jgi:glutamate racemase
MAAGPVAVFDSGVGGLSVLGQVRALLPDTDLWYVADQGNGPYGERSLEEVRRRAVAISRHLIAGGARVVVVACNSASAAALHHLRTAFPDVPFVGMEPALKPAAAASRTGIVGVLATEATFQGELFASLMDRHGRDIAVIARACPGLAQAVEDVDAEPAQVTALLDSFVVPVVQRGADVIVLGCTHYSFLEEQIAAVAGDGVVVIDPGPAVARRVEVVVTEMGRIGRAATVRMETTGSPQVFAHQVERLLGWSDVVTSAAIIDHEP